MAADSELDSANSATENKSKNNTSNKNNNNNNTNRTTAVTTEIPSIDLEMSRHNEAKRLEETVKMTGTENVDVQKDPENNYNDYKEKYYKGPRLWRAIVKKWQISSEIFSLLIVFVVLWAIAYTQSAEMFALDATLVRIAFLFVGAQLCGMLVTFARLPDMLGMLFFGVLYTNVGLSDFSEYSQLEGFLREIALVNIMLLAGLGLDVKSFKKLFGVIMRLTLIPTVAEVAIIAILAYFILKMPWLWGFLLGLVITAVSPNVVVTVMLKLKEDQLGMNSGIHTLIYAMTTCNDVLSIFGFGVLIGVIFSQGTLTQQLLQGPIGITIGIVFGFVYGLMLSQVPSRKSKYVAGTRFMMTLLGGILCVAGSKSINFPSAGAIGCVLITCVAKYRWERQGDYENIKINERLDLLWKFLKPVSFSLIGKEVNFSTLDPSIVGYGAAIIVIGCFFRLTTAYLSTYGSRLTWKERAYVTISGFPKATVQAALGPIALDTVRMSISANTPENLNLATNVLVISVLAIIFTAPLGAILMVRLAPVWLKRSNPNNGIISTTTTTPSRITNQGPEVGEEERYRRRQGELVGQGNF